jgi:hypothetical protein
MSEPQGSTVALSCSVGAIPRRASPFSGKRSGDCPYADDNPPPLLFALSHSEHPTPNGFKVDRQMALAR